MNDVIKLNIQSNNEPYELKIRKWNCNHQIPRASIILIHGIKDHVDRYNSLANTLVTNGYVVYGYDQKGHGLSISEKYEYGFIGDNEGTINSLLTDLDEVVKLVRKENSKKKVFIIGHNIGGVVALRYAQLYNDLIDGLILSGVPFESKTSIYIKKWSSAIVRKMALRCCRRMSTAATIRLRWKRKEFALALWRSRISAAVSFAL